MAETKSDILDSILTELRSFVVAFSGGVDSSFLLYRAHGLKKVDITGITIRTPYIPSSEIEEASAFAEAYGIKHRIIDLDFPDSLRYNTESRCYICKKTLFTEVKRYAAENGYLHVIEGTNADDTGEYRPGIKALRELGIRSPLQEAGLTKKEIREILRQNGLSIWDKPAMSCLLTRIPYDTKVQESMLCMVEKAEKYLFERGYPGTRVRLHGDIARIECLPVYFEKIIQSEERKEISSFLKKTGFRYVSLDLEGYRSGSLNEK